MSDTNENESVLWGVRKGDEDWQEVVLSTQPQNFKHVKELASRDGYNRFRIATIDLSKAPNFLVAISTPKTSKIRRRP